jgi:hypothetical protein
VSAGDTARWDARQRRHLAIVHPEAAAVALLPTRGGALALPSIDTAWDYPSAVPELPEPTPPGVPRHTVLTCLAEIEGEEAPAPGRIERLLWAEAMPGVAAAVAWWSADDDAPAALPAALLPVLREAVEGAAEARPALPHTCRGATPTLMAALAADPTVGPLVSFEPGAPNALRQRRAWSVSTVWANEAVFVKVSPPRWAAEGPVTAWLAELAPGRVPPVLAAGCATGPAGVLPWFVLPRVPHAVLDGDARERCAVAMGGLVRLAQRELEVGIAHGLDDRTPAAVAAGLDEVWASPELVALDPAEWARLPELDARLRRRLAALDADGMPHVLVHGDLHGGNVLGGVDGPATDTVIDWSDASLGWPGVDLLTVIGFDAALDDAVTERVLRAYADAAGPALGRDGAAAVRLGLRAAAACHALSYARIAATTPPAQRWHLSGVVRDLVRRMLRDEGLT